jgi:predicted transcriptional regulator
MISRATTAESKWPLEVATEIVSANVSNNAVEPDQLPALIE